MRGSGAVKPATRTRQAAQKKKTRNLTAESPPPTICGRIAEKPGVDFMLRRASITKHVKGPSTSSRRFEWKHSTSAWDFAASHGPWGRGTPEATGEAGCLRAPLPQGLGCGRVKHHRTEGRTAERPHSLAIRTAERSSTRAGQLGSGEAGRQRILLLPAALPEKGGFSVLPPPSNTTCQRCHPQKRCWRDPQEPRCGCEHDIALRRRYTPQALQAC